MTSVEESVSVDAAVPSHHVDVPTEESPSTAVATLSLPPPPPAAAPSAKAPPPPSSSAGIQVHAPYQVDTVTPRPSITALVNNGGGGGATPVVKENKNGASTPNTTTTKIKGRPSQAPLNAARVARSKEGPSRSLSEGQPHRTQRRQLSAPVKHASAAGAAAASTHNGAASTNAAGATVLSTSTRRLAGTGDAAKSATPASDRATSILLRRPRFVDPMATPNSTTPAATAASAPTAAAAETVPPPQSPASLQSSLAPQRRAGTSTVLPPPSSTASTSAVTHAALYLHPIPRPHPTRTPQRGTVSAEKAAADAHHRRHLLSSVRSTSSTTNGAAATDTTTATAMGNTEEVVAPPPAAGSPLTPASPGPQVEVPTAVSFVTDSEAGAEVSAKVAPEAGEPAAAVSNAGGQKGKAEDDVPPISPTTTEPAAKTSSRGGREAHVKIPSTSVATHAEKKVVHSRPTTNPYSLRMSELTRPSEAYKLSLNSSLQGSALARRSRQPRKVLNVFLTKYPVIRKLADEMDFVLETTEDELNEYKFNLCWSDTVLSLMRLVRLSNWQRTNHFPSMYLLCRKGHLGTTLGKLRHKLPSHFAFYPRTWSMRSERLQFTQYMAAVRQRHILKYFIMKPNSGCQGRGIIVARDPLAALDDHTLDNYIVQEYVHRPLLLEGKKFDLRVYVLLTSIRHPSIFLFNDGLVRICTEQYETPTEENVKNACKHLTNYAVNKKSSDYVFNTDVEHMDVGNKRNFAFLNRWLEDSGYSSAELWRQVGIIIVKTILAAQPSIARVYDSCFPTGFNDGYCCFEVLGFDILIDHKMKPWLMEVNHTPSFATDTPLDLDIKSKLLREVWSIIDCKASDYEKDRQRERDEFTKRNMPPWTTNHPLYGSQLNQSSSRQGPVDSVADTSAAAAAGDVGTPTVGNGQAEIPAYVHTRRAHEDSKLRNFSRIYPSEEAEVQLTYDTIQNLALAESANNRLYYNTTVAAPLPPTAMTGSTAPYGMRSNNVMPLRARPPTLGPVLTTSRVYSGTSSPNTAAPQRSPASPTPATATTPLAPPNGAPATITVSSVPSLTITREGRQSTSPTPASATSPHAPSSVASRGENSARLRISQAGAVPSNLSTSRVSPTAASAEAPAPPLSSASLTATANGDDTAKADGAGGRRSTGATPKTADRSAQPVRVYTPRVSSPLANSRTTTAASTPSASVAKSQLSASVGASGGETTTAAKPRVAEVHRRASSRPSIASLSAPALADTTPSEERAAAATVTAAEPSTTPNSVALPSRKATPSKAEAAATAPGTTTTATTTSNNNTYHQKGSVVTPPPGAEAQKSHPTAPVIRITRTSVSRQKSPSLDVSVNYAEQQQQLSSSMTKRRSHSASGSGRDAFDGVSPNNNNNNSGGAAALHGRQRSTERDGRSMSTHPEPTEEELARLVALQAQLDYEAAADPKPDDEDEDYNLTE